jgi:hypothetical protein
MKCPLLLIAYGGTSINADCISSNCAWWHGDSCAILSIAQAICIIQKCFEVDK